MNSATQYPPIGLAMLASVLREAGHEVTIIDANIFKEPGSRLANRIGALKPDLAGITVNIISARAGVQLATTLKRLDPALAICLGGPFVTDKSGPLLKKYGMDFAVYGEGEVTFSELCSGKPPAGIGGLVYFDGTGITVNPPRPLLEDINTLPLPAYDLLPPLGLYRCRSRGTPVGPVFTSRGCPFHCTYCTSVVFGKKFRAHSPDYIMKNILHLTKNHGIRQLDILDDHFTLDMDRAEETLDRIIHADLKLHLNFQNGIRTEKLTPAFVRKMKKAGTFKVNIGIESGSVEILGKVKKNLDLQNIIDAIRMFRAEGIITVGLFILGLPFDTEDTIRETIDFAIKADPTMTSFALYMPFPGTEMHDYLRQNGLLTGENELGFDSGFYTNRLYHINPNLSSERTITLQKQALRAFNLRTGKIIETLGTIRTFEELKWTIRASADLARSTGFFH